jgi:hypothetical protein
MKRPIWITAVVIAFSAVIWAVAQLSAPSSELSALFPDNALLYLQANDFSSLLKDWDKSDAKRV